MTWNIKGTWHESCASEGHCSFYFGRDREEPCKQIVVYDIKEGEIVLWDAHYSPNEGRLPLENLMDNPGFRLVKLIRPEKPFKVLGGYDYEIYIFQRINEDDAVDNYLIRDSLLKD